MRMFKVWFREDRHNANTAWDRRDFKWFNRDLKEGAVFNTVAVVRCRDINGVFERCNNIDEPWVNRKPTYENPDRVLEVTNDRYDVITEDDEGFFKRSMMVGDVIEENISCVDENGNRIYAERYWMCDHVGWTEFRTRGENRREIGPIWEKKEV